jgi:hypothetical protein
MQPFWSWIGFSLLWEMVCWAIREASMLSLRIGGGVSFVFEEGVRERGWERMGWERRRGMRTYEDMSLTIPAIPRPWEVDRRMCSCSWSCHFLGSQKSVSRGVV